MKHRSNGKSTCSFCGDKFRTIKARFKHARHCTEKPAHMRKSPKLYP